MDSIYSSNNESNSSYSIYKSKDKKYNYSHFSNKMQSCFSLPKVNQKFIKQSYESHQLLDLNNKSLDNSLNNSSNIRKFIQDKTRQAIHSLQRHIHKNKTIHPMAQIKKNYFNPNINHQYQNVNINRSLRNTVYNHVKIQSYHQSQFKSKSNQKQTCNQDSQSNKLSNEKKLFYQNQNKQNRKSSSKSSFQKFNLMKILNEKKQFFIRYQQKHFNQQNASLLQSLESNNKFYHSITQPKKISANPLLNKKQSQNKAQKDQQNTHSRTSKALEAIKKTSNNISNINYNYPQNHSHGQRVSLLNIKKPKKQKYGFVQLQNQCFTSIFPMLRYGASLASSQTMIFIFGGYSASNKSHLGNQVYLHSYNFQQQSKWITLPNKGQTPSMPLCYHTSQFYRNYVFFIGGFCINMNKQKRTYHNEILSYNLELSFFQKISFNFLLRSHASTIFSNNLVIYGGINQKENYLNYFHFIAFNVLNIKNPVIISWFLQGQDFPNNGLAYHKIVNTYDCDKQTKNKLQIQGIFLFGGKDSKGKMSNQIFLFQAKGSFSQVELKGKKWNQVNILGPKPQARYDHAMNILRNKPILIVIGGRNKNHQILKDIWCLNLKSLKWKQVTFSSEITPIQRGLTFMSSSSSNSKIFIYGIQQKQQNQSIATFFYIETQSFSFYDKKKSYRFIAFQNDQKQ